jgi:hypothetical protein
MKVQGLNMAESQAERLKKELRFLKESYEAGIISEEEFKKGKDRIEKRLAEWGEGVVEQYNIKKEEVKQEDLVTYGKKAEKKQIAAKKVEKKIEEPEEETEEDVQKSK